MFDLGQVLVWACVILGCCSVASTAIVYSAVVLSKRMAHWEID